MALFPPGRRFPGSPRAGPALSGLSRPGPQLHIGVHMYRTKIGILMLLAALSICAKDFDGKRALEYSRKAVEFGPRPPGSPAIHKLQGYILAQLKLHKCTVTQDDFTAQTPGGPVGMKNIIARFAGTSGRAIVLTGHYDTKVLPGFVGANRSEERR